MQRRRLGAQGLEVSALGLGCLGMSDFYRPPAEREAIATIHRAVELGIDLLDTADCYGPFTNEELVGKAIRGRRQRVIVATKFGFRRAPDGSWQGLCGRPEYVRQACEASLRRLGVDAIDLYQQHRVDPEVPIEDTVGAMADLVRRGKVRWIGVSEAGPAELRRAHAVHPLSTIQTEFSLWSREPAAEVLPVARQLGIGFLAYSPLGRGFLTGSIRSPQDLSAADYRNRLPRFQGKNLSRNLRRVERVRALAAGKGATAAQLALAWVLAQGVDVVPLVGTARRLHLEENLGALDLVLSPADLAALDEVLPPGAAAGPRYPSGSR